MELFTFARSESACYYNLAEPPPREERVLSRASHSFAVRVLPVGGDQGRVEIHLIAHTDDDQTDARRLLTGQFVTFDAGKAQCFRSSDRERMLAVIEAGFGDFHDFNRIARTLFASRLHGEPSSKYAPSRCSSVVPS